MALLTSTSSRTGVFAPRCARCLSLATRAQLPHHPISRRPDLCRTTSRPAHRRNYATQEDQFTHDSIRRREDGSVVLDMTGRVDPNEPFDLDPNQPLPADGKHIAIVGGGLTGLTTAYYMASVVKPSTKITLYEANSRLGGWIRTDPVPVNVGGKKGIVNFERGPRSLSSLTKNTSRFDDLVFYDLVWAGRRHPLVKPNADVASPTVYSTRPSTSGCPEPTSIPLLSRPPRPRTHLDLSVHFGIHERRTLVEDHTGCCPRLSQIRPCWKADARRGAIYRATNEAHLRKQRRSRQHHVRFDTWYLRW